MEVLEGKENIFHGVFDDVCELELACLKMLETNGNYDPFIPNYADAIIVNDDAEFPVVATIAEAMLSAFKNEKHFCHCFNYHDDITLLFFTKNFDDMRDILLSMTNSITNETSSVFLKKLEKETSYRITNLVMKINHLK